MAERLVASFLHLDGVPAGLTSPRKEITITSGTWKDTRSQAALKKLKGAAI